MKLRSRSIRKIADEFDAWLEQHISDMLEIPGFLGAESFAVEGDTPGRTGRVVQYTVDDEQSLEDYLGGPAEAMHRSGTLRFGDRVSASRRVLRQTASAAAEPLPVAACLNCGAPLQGQYCANCGQRARGRLISMWELVRDAVGDLFELDSRLWRTLIPLVLRPGKLTHEYLVGRRARFMPPFRTYLVLSVIFFLVAFFDPEEQLGILYEPSPTEAGSTGDPRTATEIRRDVLEELAAEGIEVPGMEPPPPPSGEQSAGPGTDESAGEEDSGVNFKISPEGTPTIDCDLEDFDISGPDWLTRRLTRERLQLVCERITADHGRAFLNQLLDNIPAALFVLLPLMALVLKILYPLSKRYYVEHLLFVLHFHAFFFLILTLQVLFSRLASVIGLSTSVTNVSVFVVSLYVPIYLYKAMRRVYSQGRAITILKYCVLVMTYLIGLSVILLFAAFYTAFSV